MFFSPLLFFFEDPTTGESFSLQANEKKAAAAAVAAREVNGLDYQKNKRPPWK